VTVTRARSSSRAVALMVSTNPCAAGPAFERSSHSASGSRDRSGAGAELRELALDTIPLARCNTRSTSAVRGSRLLWAGSSSLIAHLPRERSITFRMTWTVFLASGGSSRSVTFATARAGDRPASSALWASHSAVRASW